MAVIGAEPTLAVSNEHMRQVLLEAAAEATHQGYSRVSGARQDWTVVMEDLALAAGNTQQDIELAKEKARPKVGQLQEILENLQKG